TAKCCQLEPHRLACGSSQYKLNQMATLHQISALKQAGFTLEEIVRINNGEDEEALLLKKKSELLSKIAELTKQAGCICALPEYCFTNYLEPSYKEEDILVELCESVTECKDDTGELHFKTMPKLQVASIFHKGSYNTLAASYESVLRYVEDNGYEIVGAIRESYIDGVWNKEDESEWLTEI
ncbi:MAG: GyrI-like domain-containing protein, partial [Lachnospiraceae bacterium]